MPGAGATDSGAVSSPSVTPSACHLPLAGEEFGNRWAPGIGEAYAVSRGCAPLAGLAAETRISVPLFRCRQNHRIGEFGSSRISR
jgi:hypothetical protein